MVDEKDQAGMGEEEYHFTEDHPDYDVAASGTTETPVSASAQKSLGMRLQENRRIIIGVFVFLLLLGAVYKMLIPSSPSANGEIVQSVPGKAKATPSSSKSITASTESTPDVQPILTSQPIAPLPDTTALVASPPPATASEGSASGTAASSATDQLTASFAGRLTAVEQQNSAILNTIQTQYAQKMSDLELQASQLREEVKTIKAEVTEVQLAFHQLSTLLQKQAATTGGEASATSSSQPKTPQSAKQTGYTVQAIIPGRAWLKSDSGDTVTVAEGDTLRGVGRVVRIDPYDGIVSLDTGHKVITLSYGMGAND